MNKKRFLGLMLACLLCVSLISATGAASAEKLMGGWALQEMPNCDLPENLQAFFDGGLGGLMGVSYQPVLYMATQVVAGLNHMILCVGTPVVPDATGFLAALTIYEDLEGNLTITSIKEIDLTAFMEDAT